MTSHERLNEKPSVKMTGEGLEPSTHGLTYLTDFHRPWDESQVESLDYIITFSGVLRLVSEADSRETTAISPADYPIISLFKPSHSSLPIPLWRLKLSGLSSNSQHSQLLVGLFPEVALIRFTWLIWKSDALPTELPGPVRIHILTTIFLTRIPGFVQPLSQIVLHNHKSSIS